MKTPPQLTTGSAASFAWMTDDRRGRHAAVTVNSDGSGRISIYNTQLKRLLSEVSLDAADFRVLRDAIAAQLPDERQELITALRATIRALEGQPTPAECRDDQWIEHALRDARAILARVDGQTGGQG